jgi:DNA processing protein
MNKAQHSSITPAPQHLAGEERFNRLRLLRSRRVGISTFNRLLREFGSGAAALEALPEIAAEAGVAHYAPCPEAVVEAELKAGKLLGAHLLHVDDDDYPKPLHDLKDAPPFLWVLGNRELLARPQIALVGARNASSLGTRMARALATELGKQGYVVTSGLARGIDAAAHHAALDTGTIAVFASGVDVIYPTENTELAKSIRECGLIVSEQPPGFQPHARHFPARNRIVSGLAQAVVVIEAAARSGSLITARNALDQGREVLAVPGHPFDARAAGCNILIRDGAALVRKADDVIEALAPIASTPDLQTELPLAPPAESAPRSLRDTAELHSQIMDRIGPSPLAEEQLIRDLQTTSQAVTPILTDLELRGVILRRAGGLLSRA